MSGDNKITDSSGNVFVDLNIEPPAMRADPSIAFQLEQLRTAAGREQATEGCSPSGRLLAYIEFLEAGNKSSDQRRSQSIAVWQKLCDERNASIKELAGAGKAYHRIVDILLAMLITKDNEFRPTQSPVWNDIIDAKSVFDKYEEA